MINNKLRRILIKRVLKLENNLKKLRVGNCVLSGLLHLKKRNSLDFLYDEANKYFKDTYGVKKPSFKTIDKLIAKHRKIDPDGGRKYESKIDKKVYWAWENVISLINKHGKE